MKHYARLFLFVGLALLVLSACAPAAPAPAQNAPTQGASKTVTIAVFIPNGGDSYFQNKSYGYVQGGALLQASNPGVTVNVELYNAGGYDQSEKQISQVENAIQRKVNAIIVTATDGAALVPVINKAMAAGIPVVNDDVLVNTKTTTAISENSYEVGQNLAAYIARQLNGKGNVVMLKGAPGATLFTDRAQGAHDEFARYPGIKITAEQFHQVNATDGRKVMEDFLQSQGKTINAVWSTNSSVAIAATLALQAAGYKPGDVLVAGIDIHDEAIKYIGNGWLAGVVPCQPVKLARMAVQYAYAAANGQQIPARLYTTDDIVVDQKMLASFDLSDSMAPSGWKPPLR